MEGKHIMDDYVYDKLMDELLAVMKELQDGYFFEAERVDYANKLISKGMRIANRLYNLGSDDMYKFCMEHLHKEDVVK